MMCDGLQQRPLQQKRLTEDLTLSGLKRHLAVLEHPDVQQLALIVPFIQRRRGIQSLVTLQADEVGVQSPGHYFGHLGLPDPGASFDQQWLAQLNGQIDRRGQRLVSDVALTVQHRLNACNFGMHRSSSHPVETQKGWRASPRRYFHYKSPSCLEAQARVRPRSTLGLRSDIESNVGLALRITPHGMEQNNAGHAMGFPVALATCFLIRKFDVRNFLLKLLDYVFDSDPFTRTRPDGRSNGTPWQIN